MSEIIILSIFGWMIFGMIIGFCLFGLGFFNPETRKQYITTLLFCGPFFLIIWGFDSFIDWMAYGEKKHILRNWYEKL